MRESIPRGLLALGTGQALAFVCSLAVHVATGRALGPERYGEFWVVASVLNLLAVAFLTGIPVAVAKYTAEDEARAMSLRRRGLVIQGVVGPLLGASLFIGAPNLANALGRPELGPLLRTAAFALPLMGLAYVCVHHLNGLRAFARQAVALASLNLAKAVTITLAVLLGLGLEGAVRGLVVGAATFLAVAAALCGRAPGASSAATEKLVRLGLLLSAGYALVAIWGQIDVLMLQALGQGSEAVGFFTAASTLSGAAAAFSYPLLMTLFPAFSRAAAADAHAALTRTLGRALSYAFMILCPLAVGAHFVARDLLAVFYGPRYEAAAFALGPLAVGVLLYALYEILDTYMRSSGHATRSLRITATLVAIHVVMNWLLIPRLGLLGVVISVVAVCLLGLVAVGIFAVRTLHLSVPWMAAARIALLSYLVFVPFHFWKPGRPVASLLATIPCLAVYAAVLIRIRAVDADDVRRVRDVVRSVTAA